MKWDVTVVKDGQVAKFRDIEIPQAGLHTIQDYENRLRSIGYTIVSKQTADERPILPPAAIVQPPQPRPAVQPGVVFAIGGIFLLYWLYKR